MDNASIKSDQRATLGVVAICKNEERDLPGFLDNLRGWVDEIVLVDDGSTDATRRIALSGGEHVRFLESPRLEGEYYANQRNKGIDASCSDWLLHMDIDERVPPALREEILTAITAADLDGYRFRRRNYFLHRPMRGGGWQDWNLVHLARRDKFRFGGMFHESCHLDAPAERIGQLAHPMWHFNDESYAERMQKSLNYVPEVAERIRSQNRSVGWLALITEPIKEFLKKYLIKQGFRDGVPGLIFALHSASARFKAVAMVWDEQNRIPREELESALQTEEWAKR